MVTVGDWQAFLSPAPVGLVVVAVDAYVNVSPGTWCQKVSDAPRIVMVARKLGSDTERLLSSRSGIRFVLSIPPRGFEEDVLLCSQPVPYGVSELTIPGVRFRIASREQDHVFLTPMLAHAVCTVVPSMPWVVMGDHRVFFAEVSELRQGDDRLHPHNVMLHQSTKVFADVGALQMCHGWNPS